jgi:high-affinity Fe2+/Pb2+ permease
MLNTLLLSGYIPPSSGVIDFFLGLLAFSVLAGVLVLWWGVRLIKRDKWIGLLLVLVAVALPVLGWNLLGSIF